MNALLDPSLAALSEENADLRRQVQLATASLERANKTTASLRERLRICREALEGLLKYAERQQCSHEDTHRGGAIWTICNGCGQKWADDRGGFPGYVEPEEFKRAHDALAESK